MKIAGPARSPNRPVRPSRRRYLLPFLAYGALLLAAPGCDLEFPSQEVWIRHHVSSDSMDILLIYRGVSAGESGADGLQKAVAAAERVLAGRREFMIIDWPLYWDLDDIEEGLTEALAQDPPGEPDDARTRARERRLAERGAEIVRHFSIRAVGTFLDEEERLCGYQIVHVGNVSTVIELANRILAEQILAAVEAELEATEPRSADEPDRATLALWREKCRSRVPWFDFRHGKLELSIPFSVADADRLRRDAFRELLRLQEKGDRKFLGLFSDLLAQLEFFSYQHEEMVLVFADSRSGILNFQLEVPGREYDPALLDALQDREHLPDLSLTLDAVRRLVHTF